MNKFCFSWKALGLMVVLCSHITGSEIILYNPSKLGPTVTAKNKILIKGETPFKESVFINGTPIDVQPNGRFYERYPIAIPSRQTLLITVLDAEKNPHHIQRHVVALPGPSDIDSIKDPVRSDYLYTINSQFIHETMHQKNLFEPVSRAELAYLSHAILKQNPKDTQPINYPDIPDNYWARPAITQLVANQIMREYMDGQFYPNKPISMIEYIITVVRALNLESKSAEQPLPYSDIDPNDWTTRFVSLAYAHQLIPDRAQLNGNALLDYQTFLSLLQRLPDIQAHIQAQRDTPIPAADIPSIMATIDTYNQHANTKISMNNLRHGDILYAPTATLSVTVSPATPFQFNQTTLTPDASGHRQIAVSLFEPGPVPLTITVGPIKKTMTAYYFPWYPELNKHWISGTISRLCYVRKRETPRTFSPTQTMNRTEFKALFLWATGLPETTDTTPWFSDTGSTARLTRAEAGAAIAKFIGHTPDRTSSMDNSVFRDVPNGHWFRPYLSTLLAKNIVRANAQFHLNRPITEAEVVHMLSQTAPVQHDLNAAL